MKNSLFNIIECVDKNFSFGSIRSDKTKTHMELFIL